MDGFAPAGQRRWQAGGRAAGGVPHRPFGPLPPEGEDEVTTAPKEFTEL